MHNEALAIVIGTETTALVGHTPCHKLSGQPKIYWVETLTSIGERRPLAKPSTYFFQASAEVNLPGAIPGEARPIRNRLFASRLQDDQIASLSSACRQFLWVIFAVDHANIERYLRVGTT